MKKIFTLALSLGLLSSAFAQSGHSRTVIVSPSRTVVVDHQFDRMENDKKAQIQKVNREYDFKISQVQSNRFMKKNEKKRQIRLLEQQRQQQIDMINTRFSHLGRDGRRY